MSDISYGPNFLRDYAGNIVGEPSIAVIEIIANAYDAGATEVVITWPDSNEGDFSFADNGIGLTEDEFSSIWNQLSFDRTARFGKGARIPTSARNVIKSRPAFGANGKGRHAPFCFARTFDLISKPEVGANIAKRVTRTDSPESPFTSENISAPPRITHGVTLRGFLHAGAPYLSVERLKELIGSKFLVDPTFKIFVNGEQISFLDIEGLETTELLADGRTVRVYFFNSASAEAKVRFKGVAWWVKNRLVGEPDWSNIMTHRPYLDGRFTAAKKAAFIVQADHLEKSVMPDWSGFSSLSTDAPTFEAVDEYVTAKLAELSADERDEKKEKAILGNAAEIRDLTPYARQHVVQFVEDSISQCKRLSQEDLTSLVGIFTKLEKSKSGFNLIQELAKCSSDDLDKWNEIIVRWSASTASLVLDEIHKRLLLVGKLAELARDPGARELQELQPIFDNGLWIFGPEFEGILDFHSNRTLKTIIEKSFNGAKAKLTKPNKRPDFVASVYSSDKVNDDSGMSTELGKVLIIELKKSGVPIADPEINQAKAYAKALKESGNQVTDATPIEVHVLGSTIHKLARMESVVDLNIRIFPCSYDGIIQQAHARLHHLKRKIEKLGLPAVKEDKSIARALAMGTQLGLLGK